MHMHIFKIMYFNIPLEIWFTKISLKLKCIDVLYFFRLGYFDRFLRCIKSYVRINCY